MNIRTTSIGVQISELHIDASVVVLFEELDSLIKALQVIQAVSSRNDRQAQDAKKLIAWNEGVA
ncbi:MAG: hypothetical protein GY938_33250 [Ketobacter sp.]|nr:hypothetical protein [Ketobacter sp.]